MSVRYLHESNQGNLAVSVVSYEEQVRGRLAFLSQARTPERHVRGYYWLRETQEFYCGLRVMEFDAAAQRIYQKLRTEHRRTKASDLKIAATAIANDAILVTRNTQDFISIANLRLDNWA
ncbi:MAG: type II toxin-antitoxin system VapC family toxin [Blastocatellia bacterium]